MSQFMKSFGNNSSGGGRGNRPPLQTNICLQIRGHDPSAPHGGTVHGVVVAPAWLAGEEVGVRLMNEAESVATFRKDRSPAENRKFFDKSRPTIDKLMNGFQVGRNQIPAMGEGGFLMMYGCTKDVVSKEQGVPTVWKAQYAENFGNDAGRRILYPGLGRVTVNEATETHSAYGNLDMLYPQFATTIQSIDDLRQFFDVCMDGQHDGTEHNAQSVIRAITPGGDVKSFFTYSAKAKVEREDGTTFNVPASAAQTWKEAVEEGVQAKGAIKVIAAALKGDYAGLSAEHAGMAKGLNADLAAGTIMLEAIPGRRIPLVGDSLEWVMDPGNKLSKAAARCNMKVEDGQSPDGFRMVKGFVGMTVGVMERGPRAPGLPEAIIVTKFAVDEFAKAKGPSFIPTENFKPAYTQRVDQAAEQAAANAAAQGGVSQTEYDDPRGDEPEAAAGQERGNDGPGV